jgi:Zn finger protein HypA/HybF involved in hydrogenase expression
VFDLKDFQIKCPNCGAVTTEPVSGTELELEYVELEEP